MVHKQATCTKFDGHAALSGAKAEGGGGGEGGVGEVRHKRPLGEGTSVEV